MFSAKDILEEFSEAAGEHSMVFEKDSTDRWRTASQEAIEYKYSLRQQAWAEASAAGRKLKRENPQWRERFNKYWLAWMNDPLHPERKKTRNAHQSVYNKSEAGKAAKDRWRAKIAANPEAAKALKEREKLQRKARYERDGK